MSESGASIPELIDTWQEALESVVDVCVPLDDEQWQAQTPCPGWLVADIAAHVTDIEQTLAGLPRPVHEPDWATLPHVDRDLSRFTEIGVDARRGHPRDSVLDELRAVIAIRRQQLEATPPGAEVPGPLGRPTTLERLLRVRTFDTWVHEQDVRTAIGEDGHWATRPARISLLQMTSALPYAWARSTGAPAGSTLRVLVTGSDLVADVTVIADDDGKGRAVDTAEAPTVTLTCSWPDFMRLACGRIDPADAALLQRITLDGDAVLGQALLPAMSITP